MKKLLLLFILLILIYPISGSCDDDQININTASAEELDEIYGIGPSKAQAIIDMTSSNSPGAYVNRGNPYRVITMVISMRNYGTPGGVAAIERRVRAQGA